MKNLHFKIIFLFLTLNGCATTSMTSFTDPNFKNTTYSRILVFVNTNDLNRRFDFESRLVKVFSDVGIYAVEGYKLFPPTRNLSDSAKIELLVRDSIEAYLSVSVGESGVKQIYIPPTTATTKTEGTATVIGNTVTYNEKSKTTIDDGYTLSKPWAKFETKLYDVRTGQNAWVASSYSAGSAYSNFEDLLDSFCDEILGQLSSSKIIIDKISLTDQGYVNPNLIDSTFKKNIYPQALRKFVRLTLLNAEQIEVFIVGETESKYYYSSKRDYTNKLYWVRKSFISRTELIN